MPRVYALLVGINGYETGVDPLLGCLNDVANAEDYLNGALRDPAILVLRDREAQREEVIRQFRKHLAQAGKGDVAYFHYCGHGARSPAAYEFLDYDLTTKDEGLVCFDSREPGHFDLADKELARLIDELAAREAHVVVTLDCCHSGTATRSFDAASNTGARTAPGATYPARPLETYLGGYYADLKRAGKPLASPRAKHMLLAACDRRQLAKEDLNDHKGIFTTRLLDVLRHAPDSISYADLFVQTRAAVRQYIRDNDKSPQDPQFEAIGNFNAFSGVLGRAGSMARPRFRAYHMPDGQNSTEWRVDCGAIQGMSTDAGEAVSLALYPEGGGDERAGVAQTRNVGAQASDIALDFAGDPAKAYGAEIISMPAAPLIVAYDGSGGVRDALSAALATDSMVCVTLGEPGTDDGYALSERKGALDLRRSNSDDVIGSVDLTSDVAQWTAAAMHLLGHVARWQRALTLDNPKPRLDPDKIAFVFAEALPGGGMVDHVGPAFTLDYRKVDGEWRSVTGALKLRNRTGQTLHYILAHYSKDFGVDIIANDEIAPGDAFVTMVVGTDEPSPEVFFNVDGDDAQSVERLKLIISTERVDDFLMVMDPISNARGFGSGTAPEQTAKPIENDWLVKDMAVTIVRRVEEVGPSDTKVADGQIVIKGHPSVTANVAMLSAKADGRGVGDDDFAQTFERRGMNLIGFGGARGDAAHVLELSDIGNAQALAATPLELAITIPLGPDEVITPLIFDGRHALLAGDTWRDDDGTTRVSIDHVPATEVGGRSVGSALRMYFFKTYLKRPDVNLLRWIEYKADGSFDYRSDGLADKVAAAKSLLLLVHGIIGDTLSLVDGVKACGLDARFDLVLTYDYENLSTPIEQTARALKTSLAAAGLTAGDDKQLTMLVHSMGGLVARWFIEREGGNAVVDHLVMCGTPNHGSPFGEVAGARKILGLLATISANYVPMFSGPALFLLGRSKNLTPTLEQMNPAGDFIRTLGDSADPGVRYTILAGDIDTYKEPGDAFFADLLVKAGRSVVFDTLFAHKANDIAVGVESIMSVSAQTMTLPTRHGVACHHLNYFSSAAGQQALIAVAWDA